MSRFYEALQLSGVDLDNDAAPATLTAPPIQDISKPFEDRLHSLLRRIESMLHVDGGKVVSVVGLQTLDQSFTYSFELARLAATQLKLRVLVLCTLDSGFCQKVLRDERVTRGWEQAAFKDMPLAETIHKLANPPISVSQMNVSYESLAALSASARCGNFMRRLRKRYDLIIVDSRPFAEGMDAAILSPIADGSLLVVDAGATRWQVVRNAVEQIVSQQGVLLGVVLNKRKHYIPNFIYRRL